jgi:hypothetical protein
MRPASSTSNYGCAKVTKEMSIQNELSSEIAVALITREGQNPERLREMKELILRVHSTLRRINESEQKRAHAQTASANKDPRLKG